MLAGTNQIIELQKTYKELGQSCMDTALRTSEVLLEKSESLIQLELDAIKEALEENRQYAKKLSTMKDSSDYASFAPKFTDATLQKTLSFWSKSYDIAWQAQTEVAQLATQGMERMTRDVIDAITRNGNGSPVSELTMTAFKNATEAVNQTLSSMTRAVRQASTANALSSTNTAARKAKS